MLADSEECKVGKGELIEGGFAVVYVGENVFAVGEHVGEVGFVGSVDVFLVFDFDAVDD